MATLSTTPQKYPTTQAQDSELNCTWWSMEWANTDSSSPDRRDIFPQTMFIGQNPMDTSGTTLPQAQQEPMPPLDITATIQSAVIYSTVMVPPTAT